MKIGVAMPIAAGEDGTNHRYSEIREIAVGVERNGLDSIWVFDHLLYRFPGTDANGPWEAWTILSSLAEATSRVELGSIVLCTAFRNPALLAKMTDTLQEVSGGRFILGVGAGWHEPEFDAFGYPFDHRVGRFEEAIRIIAPLVRTGAVDFTGEYERAPESLILPRGPKPAPILIAGGRPRMLGLVAEHADAWNTAWLGWPGETLAGRVAELHAACADIGRDPAEIELNIGINVAFPELGADAEKAADRELFISGSAEEIAEAFRAHEAAGAGHLVIWPHPFTAPSYERIAEAVAVYRRG
jgi:alkanesulfonate monooxygenase SsuD/methylene tetrahydromethanopterin reductase-like flavin-dependent oxidoreductase (luciferase family)